MWQSKMLVIHSLEFVSCSSPTGQWKRIQFVRSNSWATRTVSKQPCNCSPLRFETGHFFFYVRASHSWMHRNVMLVNFCLAKNTYVYFSSTLQWETNAAEIFHLPCRPPGCNIIHHTSSVGTRGGKKVLKFQGETHTNCFLDLICALMACLDKTLGLYLEKTSMLPGNDSDLLHRAHNALNEGRSRHPEIRSRCGGREGGRESDRTDVCESFLGGLHFPRFLTDGW